MRLAFSDVGRFARLPNGPTTAHGLMLDVTTGPARDVLEQMTRGAFDAGEYSLSDYLRSFAAQENSYIALPVFPHRVFRHSMLWVPAASSLTRLDQLAGTRLGIGAYATTALLFLRGLLEDEHGVAPSDVTWVRTERERMPIHLSGLRIEDVGTDIDSLFESGGVDAIAAFRPPRSAGDDPPRARRLVHDVSKVESAYHERTGIYPIMHVLVLRRSMDEADPTVAPRLIAALRELSRADHKAASAELSGRAAIDSDRATLEAAVRYARSQYGTSLPGEVAELFSASVRA